MVYGDGQVGCYESVCRRINKFFSVVNQRFLNIYRALGNSGSLQVQKRTTKAGWWIPAQECLWWTAADAQLFDFGRTFWAIL
jgi:hypothetical protein